MHLASIETNQFPERESDAMHAAYYAVLRRLKWNLVSQKQIFCILKIFCDWSVLILQATKWTFAQQFRSPIISALIMSVSQLKKKIGIAQIVQNHFIFAKTISTSCHHQYLHI